MLCIYTYKPTPRISYILDLIFLGVLNVEYKITNDLNEFLDFQGPKINYSYKRIGEELFIEPSGLLAEDFIEFKTIDVSDWHDTKIFFKTSGKADLPFDIFSASFYLVSRYEEYLPFEPDKHKRYRAEDSLAFKNNFLQKPVINIWAEYLKQLISEKYPGYVISGRPYKYISTFDIDNVYSYKGKGFFRSAGGVLKSLAGGDFQAIRKRIKVLSGRESDPFDHYVSHRRIIKKNGIPVIYFLLFSKKTHFDGGVSPGSRAYKNLINTLKEYADIGIHPSYYSFEKQELLCKQINDLGAAINSPVIKSRQHFLRLAFPDTYQHLLQAGIKEDYSMGYASHLGFRAGICSPFYFYDLKSETPTSLKIYPFCIMDSVMFDYMKIKAEQALPYISKIIDEVKNVNGTLITIWHDRTFSDTGIFKGWKNVFAETVKMACNK